MSASRPEITRAALIARCRSLPPDTIVHQSGGRCAFDLLVESQGFDRAETWPTCCEVRHRGNTATYPIDDDVEAAIDAIDDASYRKWKAHHGTALTAAEVLAAIA